jgi:GAF domain-containing protein
VLGLTLSPLHRHVDETVDRVLFHKRHEDERALVEFGREAAFVTTPSALLDGTIANLEHHTDARSAAIFLDGNGRYAPMRSFGEAAPPAIDENDAAVLALKARHIPIDPHRYRSGLDGALALPMLARGRLLGIVVLGERTGGEAYAPDEIEALSQMTDGIGSALDLLGTTERSSRVSLADQLETIARALRASPP